MIEIRNIFPDTFYQPLFDAVGEGMVVVDMMGKIVLSNKRVAVMFGYGVDELVGEEVNILTPKSLREKHAGHINKFFTAPSNRLMTASHGLLGEKKGGEQFPIEIGLNHFENNGQTYAIALITDISERRRAEEKIAELNEQLEQKVLERTDQLLTSQKLYNAIARNFPDGTINVFDKDLNYVFVEGKELFKLGITSEKLIGSNYIKRLPNQISGHVKKKLLEVFNGEICNIEIELKGNYYVLNAVPLPNANGEITQILVIEKNIGLQKLSELEMKKNLLREQELNNLKSRFVSMASHEFRTPLGAILSSASLIGKYTKEDQQEKRDKHVKRIKSSVENLIRILDDFLSFDRLESGKINCDPSDFNVEELCKMVVDDMSGLLKDGQEIICLHEGSCPEVHLDRQLMGNIIVNLLSNAVKYSEEYQEIHITTHCNEQDLLLTIKDSGMGIPEKEQKHLFERFFRAKNAINIQGTGLGLNIVKKYVDLLKGEIYCESAEGVGTTFYVKLPRRI